MRQRFEAPACGPITDAASMQKSFFRDGALKIGEPVGRHVRGRGRTGRRIGARLRQAPLRPMLFANDNA